MSAEENELQWRNRELSILNGIAEALNRQVNLKEALEAALSQVARLFGLETGWVWLLRADQSSYLAAMQNLPLVLINEPERMAGSCYCLDTFAQGDLAGAANVNVVTCSRLKHIIDIANGLRYHASIPLYAHGQDGQQRKLGVMNVASTDWRELSSDDLRLLHTIGDMLAIAIERAQLFARSAEAGALEERNRLAREIHDTLAQGLSAIAMQLETADAQLDAGQPDRARNAIQQALALSRANLEETRRTVLDLRAAPLENRTLSDALIDLLKDFESHSHVRTQFQNAGVSQPLPARLEVTLYRIAQEALANVIRHAEASEVVVNLTVHAGQINMTIDDEGIGFDPRETSPDRFGLVGLSERARLMGGVLEVKSAPNAGTRIEVQLPLLDEGAPA